MPPSPGIATRKQRAGVFSGWMPPLDGLRGLAILMVLLDHFGQGLDRHDLLQHLIKTVAGLGWSGVVLFFVLSGFLITGILLDASGAENYWSYFYSRRVLRIFPVYYFSLLVLFFGLPLVAPEVAHLTPRPQETLWYFAYLQNWDGVLFDGRGQWLVGHYWSLAIEEQFYLVWPLIVYKAGLKRLPQVALGGAAFCILLRFALVASHAAPLNIYRDTFARMDALLLGAFCACLVRNPGWVESVRRYAGWMWIAPVLVINLLRGWFLAPEVQGLGFTAAALAFAALLLGTLLTMDRRTLLQRFLCSRFMRTFGKYSYGIYIWHIVVRTLLTKLEVRTLHSELPVLLSIPVLTAASLGAGMLSYVVVERPFLAFKSRFQPRFAQPTMEEASPGMRARVHASSN